VALQCLISVETNLHLLTKEETERPFVYRSWIRIYGSAKDNKSAKPHPYKQLRYIVESVEVSGFPTLQIL
jgi:hypothetical protein